MDKTPESAKEGFILVSFRIANDDGFPASEVHTRSSILVGHATSETQRIQDRVLFTCIRPHAKAAGGGTQVRRMDRDDCTQAAVGVIAHDQFLMAVSAHVVENPCHGVLLSRRSQITSRPREMHYWTLAQGSGSLCGISTIHEEDCPSDV